MLGQFPRRLSPLIVLAAFTASLLVFSQTWGQQASAGGGASITRTFQNNATTGADAYVDLSTPTANTGAGTDLNVQNMNGQDQWALLYFDLTSIPSTVTVTGATLSLYSHGGVNRGGRTHEVDLVTRSWTEGNGGAASGATWNTYDGTNNWTSPGGDYGDMSASATTPGSDGWVQFSAGAMATHVHAWVTGSSPNYGWGVWDSALDTDTRYQTQYYSREYTADATLRPKVVVTFSTTSTAWDSHSSSGGPVSDDFANSSNTVYMSGTGWKAGSYFVAYYDGGGAQVGSETRSASGGALTSQLSLGSYPGAASGTWHTLIQPSSGYTSFGSASYATITGNPDTYGLLANDSFTVQSSALPEFPTASAGLMAAALSFAAYWRLRNRRAGRVKA